MGRIRSIKPEFYIDEALAELSIWARYIFPGLWQQADSAGRLHDKPRVLKLALLPWDDVEVDILLDDLHDAGFIDRYEVDGKRYIQIKNFAKHQRLSGREVAAASLIPCPKEAPGKHPGSIGEHLGRPRCFRKGREGKGKEKESIGSNYNYVPEEPEIVGVESSFQTFGEIDREEPEREFVDIDTRSALEQQKARLRGGS